MVKPGNEAMDIVGLTRKRIANALRASKLKRQLQV